MTTRRLLALLVVLALSLGLWSIPAGSATLQRTPVTGENVMTGPSFKDGDDGGDMNGGDDDRWGSTDTIGGDGENGAAGEESGEDAGEMSSSFRGLGGVDMLRVHIQALLGFIVTLL